MCKIGKTNTPGFAVHLSHCSQKPSPHVSLCKDYIQEWRTEIIKNPYINELEWLQSIGAENRQGNISAEVIRTILRGVTLTTFEADYKIQIIWMAENLSKEGNILLKLLEEPLKIPC